MPEPRWLVDEMLGRLARYLRFVGYDTEYARGLDDSEIAERAIRERRTLVTRDRALARAVTGSVRIDSPVLSAQWAELRRAYPALRSVPSFDRCTECNGQLRAGPASSVVGSGIELPSVLVEAGGPIFVCDACGHVYWDGSHTRRVRATLAEWSGRTPS